MNNLISEQTAFELLTGGSEEGCNYFFRRHHEGVYHYFQSMGADPVLAQRLCIEVFRRLWDLRERQTSAAHLAANLYIMARHLFAEHVRQINTAPNAEEREIQARPNPDLNKELETVCQHVLLEVEAAMREMSPKRKQVLKLLMLEGLEVKEIAQKLKRSEQTVRNQKSQALDLLQRKVYDRNLLEPGVLATLLRYLEYAAKSISG